MVTVDPKIDPSWKAALRDEFDQPYFPQLKQFLSEEKSKYKIFPQGKNIFAAFNLTPFEKVKVIILGQDPYHGDNQAHGLAFSVQQGVAIPPSLVNIFKELHDDLGVELPHSGDLTSWAEQGVLLLNTVLTVRAHEAHSHKGEGWERFTDAVIRKLSLERSHLVFILWGKPAQMKKSMIDSSKHMILEAPHPSPLSAYRGFFGSKPFSKTNHYLVSQGIQPINWSL